MMDDLVELYIFDVFRPHEIKLNCVSDVSNFYVNQFIQSINIMRVIILILKLNVVANLRLGHFFFNMFILNNLLFFTCLKLFLLDSLVESKRRKIRIHYTFYHCIAI